MKKPISRARARGCPAGNTLNKYRGHSSFEGKKRLHVSKTNTQLQGLIVVSFSQQGLLHCGLQEERHGPEGCGGARSSTVRGVGGGCQEPRSPFPHGVN